MYVVEGEFEKFTKVSIFDMIGAIGVYVIWDSRSTKKPRYVGQGYLLDRLSKHNDKFYPPLDGYISIIGYDDKDRTKWKHKAELLEMALLWISEDTGRKSKANKQPARTGIMNNIFEEHGVIKFKIDGYDPFSHPQSSRNLSSEKKIIKIRPKGKEEVDIEHSWRWLRGA